MAFLTQLRSSYRIIFAAAAALACAYLSLAPVQAEAQTTYYVSPTGSDSNSGSSSSPWLTPAHSSSVAAAGDTVIFENGTYEIPAGGSNGDWHISTGGKSGSPITYKAQNKWQAKLVGTGMGDGSTIIGVSGSYVTIEGFDITGTDANGIILAVSGSSAEYNAAQNNYVHDMTTPCTSNSGTAIETGGGDDYVGVSHESILGNLVVNMIVAPGTDCHVSSGIYAETPFSVIANNIVINAGTDIQTWHAASNITIFGNTTIGGVVGVTLGAGDSPGGVTNNNSLVQNNISINASAVGLQEHGTTGSNNSFVDNLVFNNPTNVELQNGNTATGTVIADPEFVDNTGTAAGDYQLQSSSPAIGTGLALAGIATDYLGVPRPQTGATDIGACVLADTGTSSTGGPVAAGMSASATSITSGQSVTLTWNTINAVQATLNGTVVALNGSITVTPTATTTYKIVGTSATGTTDWGSVTVTVAAAPRERRR
jgi:hypothetical protein